MKELLIVARYDENVDWLKTVKQDYIIYNKGPDNLPDWVKNVVKLPNIGREEYVYLRYIYDNYDNLADRIIFSQAGVLIHSPDFLRLLECSDRFQDVQPLSFGYNTYIPQYRYVIHGITVNDLKVHVDLFDANLLRYSKVSKTMLPIDSLWVTNLFYRFFETQDIRSSLHKLLKIDTRKTFGLDVTPSCYAGIFSVIKSKIHMYDRAYYAELLRLSELIYFSHISMNLNQCLSNTQIFTSDYHIRTFGMIMELMWLELFKYNLPEHYLTIG